MDLTTNYLGLNLRNPLVVSASPLGDELGNIRRMEDAGAAAVVLPSIFEEQLTLEKFELNERMSQGTESFAEALTYFPEPEEFQLGPERYLKHIQQCKAAVDIPIIGSLNGTTVGGWTAFAREIEQAGADALECNIYYIPTDMNLSAGDVEQTYLDILQAVKGAVQIPVAVKLSPFFSNMANMARRLDQAGADGLVMFNRFYQPDVDLEALEVKPRVLMSTAQALRLPLNWIGILYGRVQCAMAGTSGIHTAQDVIKMLMVGATVTQLCSVLYKSGIGTITSIEQGITEWMETNEYDSVVQMRGSMSQINSPDPSAFERAQYMRAVKVGSPLLFTP